MILAFKKEFVEPIMNGVKIHTIRRHFLIDYEVGDVIHFATKKRYKDFDFFLKRKIIGIQNIYIERVERPEDFNAFGVPGNFIVRYKHYLYIIYIDDKPLEFNEVIALIINDGFENIDDFFDFFNSKIKDIPNNTYSGTLIHWTDKKY